MAENQDHQRYTIVVGAGMVFVEDVLTDHPPVVFQGQDRLIQAVDYAERMNNREGSDPDARQRLVAPDTFLAGELPAFAAWQRDCVRRLMAAREAEELAHQAYVSAVARRVVIETEMPPFPAERDSEPRSAASGPSVDTGVPRCS